MSKFNALLAKLLDRINATLAGSINITGALLVLLVAKSFETVFSVGTALASNASALLGVVHDNTARAKDILDGKRGGDGTGGTPPTQQ